MGFEQAIQLLAGIVTVSGGVYAAARYAPKLGRMIHAWIYGSRDAEIAALKKRNSFLEAESAKQQKAHQNRQAQLSEGRQGGPQSWMG